MGVETVASVLARGATDYARRPALSAPGRVALTHAELWDEVRALANRLRSAGVLPTDNRVAIVAPDGPEIAVAFLAACIVGAAAPLNPRYTASELEPLLAQLRPAAVLVGAGLETPARTIAADLGAAVIELVAEPSGAAGRLSRPLPEAPAGTDLPEGQDVALLLHTSGTTSRPKLVPLTHANLCASSTAIAATLELSPADRCLGVMPMFHIHGIVAALLASLRAGGSLVATPGFDPWRAVDWLRQSGATWYTAVPTIHQSLLGALGDRPAREQGIALRFARSSSAALPAPLMAALEEALGAPVVEAYGMTEAAHQIASNPLPPRARRPGSVGLPAGAEIAILDPDGRHVPAREGGEIAIRGPGVTAGYLDAPRANAEAFSDGWLRTGDLGSIDADGYLRIDGRIKEIINRGGEKIAPREIDDALAEHPAVLQGVAFAVPHPSLGEEPAAAVVLRPGAGAHPEELRAHVAARLAPFKVPRRMLVVDAIPKGPTGKLQRSALAAQLGLQSGVGTASPLGNGDMPNAVAPGTQAVPSALEAAVLGLWSAVLSQPPTSAADDFFALGGDSLTAMSLIGRVRDAFGVELELGEVFSDAATVGGMAAAIERLRASGPAPSRSEQVVTATAGTHPPSPAQRRIWWLAQLDSALPTFNVPIALRLHGRLDHLALQRALDEVVRRHGVLRTSFESSGGEPVATVLDPMPVELAPTLRFESIPAALRELAGDVREPFDLTGGVLLRGRLCEISSDEHVLALSSHHLAFDGWSRSVLVDELRTLYGAFAAGEPSPLPEPTATFGTLAARQVAALAGPALDRDLQYWRARLAGATAPEIATDRPRPTTEVARGALATARLSAETVARVERHARDWRTTPFVGLLSAFSVLLGRYARSEDVVVGCPTAGRTLGGSERLIGMFVNTLPVRLRPAPAESFRSVAADAHREVLAALEHQALPFERMVEDLQPERALGRDPLAPITFQLRNMPAPAVEQPAGMEIDDEPWDAGIVQAELALELTADADGMLCVLRYRTDLWEPETARRMLRHFTTLVDGLAAAPDDPVGSASMLGEAERRRLLRLSTGRPLRRAGRDAHRRFEEQADRAPEALAAVHREDHVSYGELNARANRLAHRLLAHGVRAEDVVAVGLPRRIDALVAMLAVLKAGGAFLPLNPADPLARRLLLLEDAAARVLVGDSRSDWGEIAGDKVALLDPGDASLAAESAENPGLAVPPDALSHVIYTSGSSGRPKAVMVERGNLEALLDWARSFFRPDELRGVLAASAFGFDVSTLELLTPLAAGGTVILVENVFDLATNPPDADISLVVSVPSALSEVLREHRLPASVRAVALAGETLGRGLVNRLYEHPGIGRVINLYGPTEDTVVGTGEVCERFASDVAPPIGRPLAGRRTLVLDERGELSPLGVPGEVHLGGAGLTRGYRDQPELTAERYVERSVEGGPLERLYRTGDLARWRADGRLEFRGRLDRQLKVRGFRIEPGEVEEAITRHPAVGAAVVTTTNDGGSELLAHVVAERPLDAAELRADLARELPSHMVPSRFVFLDALPVSERGKLDRERLPQPASTPVGLAPEDDVEATVAEVWRSVLELSRPPGRSDDFFALGGHSFLALRMIDEVQKRLDRRLPLATVFRSPVLGDFADAVRAVPTGGTGIDPGAPLVGTRIYSLFVDRAGFNGMRGLAEMLDRAITIRPLPAWDMRQGRVESVARIAAERAGLIRAEQPGGPYLLAGHSLGGVVAIEVARRLEQEGAEVGMVALFDTRARLKISALGRLRHVSSSVRSLRPAAGARHLARAARMATARSARYVASGGDEASRWSVAAPLARIYDDYHPEPIAAPLVVFCTKGSQLFANDPSLGWERVMGHPVEVVVAPGDHASLLHGAGQAVLAQELGNRLERGALR